MTLAVGDVCRVAITYSAPQASVAQNVMHWEMISGAGASESNFIGGVVTRLNAAWAEIDGFINDGYEMQQMDAWARDKAIHVWNGIGSFGFAGNVGLSAVDLHTHAVAVYAGLITEQLRRQGRTYIPGIDQNRILGGLVDGTTVAGIVLYLTALTTDISVTGGVFRWCTFNTVASSPYFETSSKFDNAFLVGTLPGTQRRRKPLVGL